MDEISKSALKAKMFEYFRRVEATKRPLVVKDFGEPVLIIQPYRRKKPLADVFSNFRGRVSIDYSALLEPELDEWEEK